MATFEDGAECSFGAETRHVLRQPHRRAVPARTKILRARADRHGGVPLQALSAHTAGTHLDACGALPARSPRAAGSQEGCEQPQRTSRGAPCAHARTELSTFERLPFECRVALAGDSAPGRGQPDRVEADTALQLARARRVGAL